MSAQKILFATDYSPASRDALNCAAALARERGVTLLIAHVSQLEEYPVGELFDEEPRASDAELEELSAVTVADPRIRCEHRLLHGDPARQIVELAKRENVETIVLGTHGRSGLGRLITGSVAEAVLRDAPCAVVACRPSVLVAAE
ncbi:MAG TPA: universal stress protein [Pirellulales bacterium]|nr:universal stress protein [Pirellulales bacterium]